MHVPINLLHTCHNAISSSTNSICQSLEMSDIFVTRNPGIILIVSELDKWNVTVHDLTSKHYSITTTDCGQYLK